MIAYNDRTLVLGPTGSGKSTLLNVQLGELRCQRVLYDSKDEWTVRDVQPVRDVDAIDWRLPIIHFIPPDGSRGDAQELFAAANTRTHLVVAVHELADLCDNNANATPPAVNRYFKQGRAHGRGMLAGSQRPVEMPRAARTEAEHVFLFPGLDPDDLDVVNRIVAQRCAGGQDVGRLIDAHELAHGEHAFIYFDKPGRTMRAFPPLPAHLIRKSPVTKRSVA